MKKTLIYTFTLMALIVSAGFTAIISSLVAAEEGSSNTLISTENNLAESSSTISLSKSENVYVITNSDGTVNKSFVNNTINDSSEPLPIEASITYSLDGSDIKAEDLVNKSGHVKITYKFTATKSFQGKFVPFLTVTGLDLDSTKFKNIKIDHGKIISESDNILLAGYTFAGLNEDLNTDMLSDSFTVEADVTNFELPDTYTFATNELFTEIDTTRLTSIDSIINSINDLGSAFDQILAGSTELTNGLNQALTGSKKIQSGAHELANGANQLNSGANELTDGMDSLTSNIALLNGGLSQLSGNSETLRQSAAQIFNALLSSTSAKIGQTLTPDNFDIILENVIEQLTPVDPETAAELTQTKALLDGYNQFLAGLNSYTTTVDEIATKTPALQIGSNQLLEGAKTLSNGTTTLTTGTNELATGTDSLVDGLDKLTAGAGTLNDGLTIFKDQGLNKLINFANNDLSSFTANLRQTVTAADSYHHYSNSNANSVKFIFKTPSIR